MHPLQAVRFITEVVDKTRGIERWNGNYLFDRSNVAEHHFRGSHWLVMIDLCIKQNRETNMNKFCGPNFRVNYDLASCLIKFIHHDLGERFTGDVNHRIKREPYPELKQILDKVEKHYLIAEMVQSQELHKIVFNTDPVIEQMSKGADNLDTIYEAVREMKLGNKDPEFPGAITRLRTLILRSDDNEIRWAVMMIFNALVDGMIDPLGPKDTGFIIPL